MKSVFGKNIRGGWESIMLMMKGIISVRWKKDLPFWSVRKVKLYH